MFMMLLALSQAVGQLETSKGPCDGKDSSLQARELGQGGKGL